MGNFASNMKRREMAKARRVRQKEWEGVGVEETDGFGIVRTRRKKINTSPYDNRFMELLIKGGIARIVTGSESKAEYRKNRIRGILKETNCGDIVSISVRGKEVIGWMLWKYGVKRMNEAIWKDSRDEGVVITMENVVEDRKTEEENIARVADGIRDGSRPKDVGDSGFGTYNKASVPQYQPGVQIPTGDRPKRIPRYGETLEERKLDNDGEPIYTKEEKEALDKGVEDTIKKLGLNPEEADKCRKMYKVEEKLDEQRKEGEVKP